MINKIRNLANIDKELKELHEAMAKQSEAFGSLKSNIAVFRNEILNAKDELGKLKKEFVSYKDEFNEFMHELAKLKSDFSQIVNDLRNAKVELINKVSDNLVRKFSNEIMSHVERVKTDVKMYNEFHEFAKQYQQSLESIKQEIDKFKSISQQIKETDFELAKYAKKLAQNDKEKLRLMREIDTLKTLVSKERQKKRRNTLY